MYDFRMKIGDFAVILGAKRESWVPRKRKGTYEATRVIIPYHHGQLGRIVNAVHTEELSGRVYDKNTMLLASSPVSFIHPEGGVYTARFFPDEYRLSGNTPEKIKDFFDSLRESRLKQIKFDVPKVLEQALRDYEPLAEADLGIYHWSEVLMDDEDRAKEEAESLNMTAMLKEAI